MSELDPVRLGDLLDAVGRKVGIRRASQIGRVWSSWSGIVGDAIAEHVEPTSLRDGVLRLRGDSPAWANEVGYLSDDIKQRVNGFLGERIVEEVRVWTGPGRVTRRDAGPTASSAEPAGRVAHHPAEAFERARRAWAKRRQERGRTPPELRS